MSRIPYNRPCFLGTESEYILAAVANGHLSGNGAFGRRSCSLIEALTHTRRAFLTPSCTAALEMAALLLDLGPGDEVIMPSFTFVATATSIALRGATPVFVDIREDTLNLDETLVEEAITEHTRAILTVHYAGVACDMDTLLAIGERHGLPVIEDGAQGLLASYKGRPLGSMGALGALSFHETKNVHCGEGGALLINDESYMARAEILQEKGTNRSKFFRGEVDKYTWVDLGSSFLVSEVTAGFLTAQLENSQSITDDRLQTWHTYHASFERLEASGAVRRPVVPEECQANGHIYYLLLPNLTERTRFIERLALDDIHAVFHYVPLHSAPAGQRFGRTHGNLAVTTELSERLVRLPLWYGMTEEEINRVVVATEQAAAQVGE